MDRQTLSEVMLALWRELNVYAETDALAAELVHKYRPLLMEAKVL